MSDAQVDAFAGLEEENERRTREIVRDIAQHGTQARQQQQAQALTAARLQEQEFQNNVEQNPAAHEPLIQGLRGRRNQALGAFEVAAAAGERASAASEARLQAAHERNLGLLNAAVPLHRAELDAFRESLARASRGGGGGGGRGGSGSDEISINPQGDVLRAREESVLNFVNPDLIGAMGLDEDEEVEVDGLLEPHAGAVSAAENTVRDTLGQGGDWGDARERASQVLQSLNLPPEVRRWALRALTAAWRPAFQADIRSTTQTSEDAAVRTRANESRQAALERAFGSARPAPGTDPFARSDPRRQR